MLAGSEPGSLFGSRDGNQRPVRGHVVSCREVLWFETCYTLFPLESIGCFQFLCAAALLQHVYPNISRRRRNGAKNILFTLNVATHTVDNKVMRYIRSILDCQLSARLKTTLHYTARLDV